MFNQNSLRKGLLLLGVWILRFIHLFFTLWMDWKRKLWKEKNGWFLDRTLIFERFIGFNSKLHRILNANVFRTLSLYLFNNNNVSAKQLWFWWLLWFSTEKNSFVFYGAVHLIKTSFKRRQKNCFSRDIVRIVHSNLVWSFVSYICQLQFWRPISSCQMRNTIMIGTNWMALKRLHVLHGIKAYHFWAKKTDRHISRVGKPIKQACLGFRLRICEFGFGAQKFYDILFLTSSL